MDPTFTFEDDVTARTVAQAPWDIPKIRETLQEEHSRNRTTSVDHKIQQQKVMREQLAKRRETWEKRQNEEESNKKEESQVTLRGKEGEDEDEDKLESGKPMGRRKRQRLERKEEHDKVASFKSEAESSPSSDLDSESEEDEDETSIKGEQKDVQKKKEAKVTVRVEEAGSTANQSEAPPPGRFFSTSRGASFSAKSFAELNLSRPLIRACEALGYSKPTPIQAACIPLAMAGRDICGSAMTGSGKTGAFALPLLERLLYRPRRIPAIRVMILTPTRELAVQVQSMVDKLAQFTDIRTCLAVGGLSNKVQEVALRSAPDVVVATPGRMLDHLSNAVSVGLEDLAVLVLDEADRLLEMGFREEVQQLVRLCPGRRQTLLFSATMTEEVSRLAQLSLHNPVRLSADPRAQRPRSLHEEVVKLRSSSLEEKEAILLALCTRSFTSRTIIFCGRKVEAHRLKIIFGLLGLKSGELHGNLTQAMRLAALEEFRKSETDFLIATDVAARGLDITGVQTVISTECPREVTTYVHRVGRTARAGNHGCAVTFVEEKHRKLLKELAKKAGSQLKARLVPQSVVAKWRAKIGELEGEISSVLREEREEAALRKAEMEANKAQNMVEHESEIFSKPKRVWFQTLKEKRAVAEAAKASKDEKDPEKDVKKVISKEELAEQRKKAKLKKEREKNLPRKQRRKLEAQREDEEERREREEEGLEDNEEEGDEATERPAKKGKGLIDVAYRKAKATKAAERLRAAGKLPRLPAEKDKGKKKKKEQKKKKELYQKNEGGNDDSNVLIDGRGISAASKSKKESSFSKGRKPGVTRKSFKSKSRFKRRK